MIYKIDKTDLVICDKWGFRLKLIAEKVAFATFDDNQNIFLVTFLNGEVKTKDINGTGLRFICENATEARFSGTDITVRTKDGKNQLRDKNGFVLRSF